jgi:hypothetical protein
MASVALSPFYRCRSETGADRATAHACSSSRPGARRAASEALVSRAEQKRRLCFVLGIGLRDGSCRCSSSSESEVGAACSRPARRLLQLGSARRMNAVSGSGVHAVVGFGDAVEWWRIGDGDRERAVACRRGQVFSGLALGEVREVVAAEQPDREVGEEHRPEREVRPIEAARVGGDDGVGGRDRGVEVGVVGERDLDGAVNAVGRVCADRAGGVRVVQRHRPRHGGVDLFEVAAALHRSDHGGATQRASWAAIDPTPPSTPWTRIVVPATGPSPKIARRAS